MFISSLFVHGKVIYLVNSTVLYHDSATITFILLHLKKLYTSLLLIFYTLQDSSTFVLQHRMFWARGDVSPRT